MVGRFEHLVPIDRFAAHVATIAKRIGLMSQPRFDQRLSRLVDASLAIDLLNMRFRVDFDKPVDEQVSKLLQPMSLQTAGFLGRIDVVRTLLAAGISPNETSGGRNTPLDSTLAAWIVTGLHFACVEALLDAGALPTPSTYDVMIIEGVGSEVAIAIAELLVRRTEDPALKDLFRTVVGMYRDESIDNELPLE